MSDVILVGVAPAQEQLIRSALGKSNSALTTWEGSTDGAEAAAALADERPLAVILGSALGEGTERADPFTKESTELAIELARHLESIDPAITTLLIAKTESENLQRAMSAGIREVVPPDATKASIREALERALDAGRRLRTSRDAAPPEATRRFIVVVSAKGGAGKTVISSNLAVGLSRASHRRTVLVDLDLQFGDAATALLLSPIYSMVDATEAAKKHLDAATLKVFLTYHSPSRLHVLCAPEDPALGESLTAADVSGVLDLLSSEFSNVVIDTDPGLSEMTLMALERATDIVIIADLDVPAVRGTRKLISALDIIGMTGARRHLVLNRANAKVGLTPAEVQESIGMRIDVALPSTRDVPISLNEGRPIAVSGQRSVFGRRIQELVENFVPVAARKELA